MTVNSLANKVSKTDYSLRGFSASPVEAVSQNNSGLSNLVVTKGGVINNDSISGDTILYAAWAKNCANNITGGVCGLNISENGGVSYTATPDSGYYCTYGCQTSNPVFAETGSDVIPDDWIRFNLDDGGGNGGIPTTFVCQKNANSTSGCAMGCYKSIDSCDNSNKFTGLDSQPSKTNFKYDGYFWNAIEILDDTGQLNGQTWTNVSGASATVVARWTEQKIDLIYNKGNCQNLPSDNPSNCTVNSTFNLLSAIPQTNQNFDGWIINNQLVSNASMNCNRDILGGTGGDSVIITARCSDKTPEQNTINLSYVATCTGQANCPILSGLPATCVSGESLNLTPVTGNTGWTFDSFCTGNACGTNFTCPDSDATIIVNFIAASSDETTININYDNGNCPMNTIPSDAVTSCNVGDQLYLNLNPDPDGNNYPYWFNAWLVNNNLIYMSDSNPAGYIDCNRETLGGAPGEAVTITARCVNVSIEYYKDCRGRGSECPGMPTTADYPHGCVTGETITIPQWTGSLPEGWDFKGWRIYGEYLTNSTLYQPGDTWTCTASTVPEGGTQIDIVFDVPIPWRSVYLDDTVADSPSNPRWLCKDTEGKLQVYSGGKTYPWYSGGNGDSPVCDADTNIQKISVPQSNHWEYGGHIWDGKNAKLIDQDGTTTNWSYANVSRASAVWNPIVGNYVTLSYVADCAGDANCPTLSEYSLSCISGDAIKLEPVPGNSYWVFDGFCMGGVCGTNFTCPSQNATITAKFKQNNETNININYEAGNCAATVVLGTVPSCTVGETFDLQLNNATGHLGWMVNNRLVQQLDLLCDRSILGGDTNSNVTMVAYCENENNMQINYYGFECSGCPSMEATPNLSVYYPTNCTSGETLVVPMNESSDPLPNGVVFMGWKVHNGLYDDAGIPYAPGQSFVCPQKTDSNNGNIWIERMYYIPE